MNHNQLLQEANRFREAIVATRDAGEFKTLKSFQRDNFPYDCCDDTADLFIHYLYHTFGIDSIKITGNYYSKRLKCTCFHTWQKTEGEIIDLTGDQFDQDSDIPIKSMPVYVGRGGEFHEQFECLCEERSCGIECLGTGSHNRMYDLYEKVMRQLNR